MSKKIASGSGSIILDVKVGSGAFMETLPEAKALAQLMVDIGAAYNRRVVAVLTDMNIPLGYNVGNSVEVREVVALLRNNNGVEARLRDLVLYLCGLGFLLTGKCGSVDEGRTIAAKLIDSGEAFEMLCRIIEAQGGDAEYLRHTVKQPTAKVKLDVRSPRDGYVRHIDASAIGIAAMRLGAGREMKDSVVDHTAGIVLRHTVGEQVGRDNILASLYASAEVTARQVASAVVDAFELSDTPVDPAPLVYETVGQL
jgi:pyrimidine-nucleoside phosphorylase